MSHGQNSHFLKHNIKNLQQCPACQSPYNPLFMRIIEETGSAHLFHLECQTCGVQVLALVTTDLSTVSSRGLVTDLKSDEVKKFQGLTPVQINEIIDLHYYLKSDGLLLSNC
ncbi:MAG: hypothetical protein WC528_05170 [Patescibacteria group bacterium]